MAEHVNSVAQLAKRLFVSTRTARRIIEIGDLKAHRIGRQWRVFEQDLQCYLARQATGRPPHALNQAPKDLKRPRTSVSSEQLTAALVHRILGWEVGPDRFVTGNRGWIPRGRFRPTERIGDACRLLSAVEPAEYSFGGGKGKPYWARVQTGDLPIEASASSMATAVCLAVAMAVGIGVDAPTEPRIPWAQPSIENETQS